jgi:cyclopropane-fatty-acyl-phospholipid synthase
MNGDRPWDLRVSDERFFRAVIRGGTLAFGESYMSGWWESDALDQLVAHLLGARLDRKLQWSASNILLLAQTVLGNAGAKAKSFNIGKHHYDIGNDLFERMLDHRMVYTSAYWRNAKNLDEAQEAKLDLVCRKMGLRAGQKVLDIGCGWGSFGKFAAEKYGARVTGITVSREQMRLGQELCKGLPVEFQLKDYRDITGTFDHAVPLGMLAQFGYKTTGPT